MDHAPTAIELDLIKIIQQFDRSEFVTLRITQTMLNKGIIDANQYIAKFFLNSQIFDFDKAIDGELYYVECDILDVGNIRNSKSSCYRPKAKPQKRGDPRFWPSGLKLTVNVGDLLYIGSKNRRLYLIPITTKVTSSNVLSKYFDKLNLPHQEQLNLVFQKLVELKDTWIRSISKNPKVCKPKDMGDTFEALMGLSANNSKGADLGGKLELKTKKTSSKTNDTLFCKVPDPDLTPLKTAKNIIFKYGYPNKDGKRPNNIDLFVTVDTRRNSQGLYHVVNRQQEVLQQFYSDGSGRVDLVAVWPFELLRNSLYTKHPATVWIKAIQKKISGEIHFKYCLDGEVTFQPLFENFLLCLESNQVVFDWRGSEPKPNTIGKKIDKGHAFRLKNNIPRSYLFGEAESFNL